IKRRVTSSQAVDRWQPKRIVRHRIFRVVHAASLSSIIEDRDLAEAGAVESRSQAGGRWNMLRKVVLLWALAGISISFLGCGGGTAVPPSDTTTARVSVSPTCGAAGSGEFTLGITRTLRLVLLI